MAALVCGGDAIAQSTTSTTMDMGGGMTHVDTMGPNGAMSSSNCMNMGGGMASCNTMDMSQPQRTYPTPDMSRPQRTYARPDTSESEPYYPAPYVSRLPMPAVAIPQSAVVGRMVAVSSPALAAAKDSAPITPKPLALISLKAIPKGTSTWDGFPRVDDTEYIIAFLGHVFSIDGPNGLTPEDIKARLDAKWEVEPWYFYSSTDTGTVYYFSVTSEKIYSDRIEIWTKADHSKDRTTKARSTMALFEIRCNQQAMRELQQTQYDANGKVLLSFDQPATLSRVIPETVGSALLDEVCKLM